MFWLSLNLWSLVDSRLWSDREFPDYAELFPMLIADVVHDEGAVREAAADGLAGAVALHPKYVKTVLDELLEVYEDKLYVCICTIAGIPSTCNPRIFIIDI